MDGWCTSKHLLSAGTMALLGVVVACSGGPVLQTPETGAGRGRSRDATLPDAQTNSADGQERTGKGSFVQRSGRFEHPADRSNISNGALEVDLAPGEITMTLSGFQSSSSRPKVVDAVKNMAGTTRFVRVPSKSLPASTKYRQHPYLVFANQVTTRNGDKFTIGDGDLIPVVVMAEGDQSAYAKLTLAPVSYQVRFTSPASFTATITVSRADSSSISFNGTTCGSSFNQASKALQTYGISIQVSGVPEGMLNKFPIPSSLFVVSLGSGGIISQIATCSLGHDPENRERVVTKMEFGRS